MDPNERGSITPETRAVLLQSYSDTARVSGNALDNLFRRRLNPPIPISAACERLLNAAELVMLAWFETSCLVHDVVYHDSGLRANLYARHLVLTLYESSNRLRGLLARQFRDDLAEVLPSRFTESELRTINSEINAFFESCRERFGDARDQIIAHREDDPEIRMRRLYDADLEDVTGYAADFLVVIARLAPVLLELTARLSADGVLGSG